MGVAVFPKDVPHLVENVVKIAGSTYSCVAAPIQHAALRRIRAITPSRSSCRTSSQQGALRGIGILFLDSRDSEEIVKERIRRFLSEAVGSGAPVEAYQREFGSDLETLMGSDWAAPEELPQFSFKVYRQTTARDYYRFLREHPLARQSEAVCPQT